MVEHVNITDPHIHEPKGASTAANGNILKANGDGTTSWAAPAVYSNVEVGWYDYNDTATTTTPIALSVANTYYDLTNNGLGVNTNKSYGLDGITDIWNSGTNRFVFTGLDIGDTLDIRVDTTYTTTSVNTAVDMILELAVGDAGVFNIPLVSSLNFKTASTNRVIGRASFYIGNEISRSLPARLRMKADNTGSSVIVNGWYVRIIKKG